MTSTRPSDLSILIVEDIDEMRMLLDAVIKGIKGLKVSGLARNSIEARQEILRRRPDLILLDEILPGESAWDFMKTHLVQEKIPVILLTSLDEGSRQIPPEALSRMAKPSWDTLKEDQQRIGRFIFDQMKKSKA